ncbi:hypothetical protein ACFQ7F_32925 [Streptomyces sp. NPDC056486]
MSVDDGRVVLRSRRGTSMGTAFPEMAAAAANLSAGAALDGVM